MSRRVLTIAVAAAVAAVAVLGTLEWWSRGVDEQLSEMPRVPAGRWNTLRPSRRVSEAEDEMARVLSLPYLSGRQEAGSRSGVVVYDQARSWPGVNLYVSGHGPEAVLLDMQGEVVHRWRLTYEEAFGGERASSDRVTESTMYWRRARLLEDGSLLAIFQAGGLIKVDRDSNLVWAVDEGFYNDLEMMPDGSILTIGKAARTIPEINPDQPVLEDSIVWVSPSGELIGRLSLLDAFRRSSFAGLLQPMADRGDILHTNTIHWLDGGQAARSELFRRDNLLVSFREVNVVAILDPVAEVVEWAARGPWEAQHQPELLEDGSVLIFDNKGAAGSSRVLEYDPLDGRISWQFPRAGAQDVVLSSPEAGSAQRLPGGTTLITESERGRALEVTRGGDVVWEFSSPHRAGAERNLVATLFDVVRLPESAADFVQRASSD